MVPSNCWTCSLKWKLTVGWLSVRFCYCAKPWETEYKGAFVSETTSPLLISREANNFTKNFPSLSLNWLTWGHWLDWWHSYSMWSWLNSKGTQKTKIIWGEYIILKVETRITVSMRKPWYPRSKLIYSLHGSIDFKMSLNEGSLDWGEL